jgi:hypothetical protein
MIVAQNVFRASVSDERSKRAAATKGSSGIVDIAA